MSVVEIENLSKQFGPQYILKNLNFSIAKGELVSIIGASGIGKTTFLNILLGLDNRFEGECRVSTERIAAVFQEDRLLPWLNVYENVRFVNKDIENEKIKAILDVMQLTDFASFPPSKLSGGMKQRVSIARALCCKADLIIMDEPLKSTDKNLSSRILDYIKTECKNQNKALIMITHDVQYALKISEFIYILEGRPAFFAERMKLSKNNKEEIANRLAKYAMTFDQNCFTEGNMNRVPGHVLLAKLGKKRLRPGGVTATNWLIEQGCFTKDSKVLEVACNRGITMREIAKKYQCDITGVDRDENFLAEAKAYFAKTHFDSKIALFNADALKLPFADNSFDIVINEAMLTMLSNADKEKAVKEYFRVLKQGGKLLTHDISMPTDKPEVVKELRRVINIAATPLLEEQWLKLFDDAGFSKITRKTGVMTLMSEEGMKKDEGEEGMKQIFENAKKDACFQQFIEMKDFFACNTGNLYYIAVCSEK